jgi:hypothetical protein
MADKKAEAKDFNIGMFLNDAECGHKAYIQKLYGDSERTRCQEKMTGK